MCSVADLALNFLWCEFHKKNKEVSTRVPTESNTAHQIFVLNIFTQNICLMISLQFFSNVHQEVIDYTQMLQLNSYLPPLPYTTILLPWESNYFRDTLLYFNIFFTLCLM